MFACEGDYTSLKIVDFGLATKLDAERYFII